MSKRVKVLVSTPAPWKADGGAYLSLSVPCGMKAEAYRRTAKDEWIVDCSGFKKVRKLPAVATEEEAVKAMKDGLRDRLLSELTALHDDAPDGDVTGGGTERPMTATEVLRNEG